MPKQPSTRVVASLGLLTGALALSACGGGGETSPGATTGTTGGGTVKVAAVIKGLDNPFFQAMEQGIKAEDPSATVQAAQDITDTSGQADRLASLVGQDFSCYVVNPISSNNLLQGVAQLKAANKTVVNIDRPLDQQAAQAANAVPNTYIGTDNVEAGRLAGQFIAKEIASGGTVGVIGGIAGDVTSGDRVKGFTEGLGGNATVLQTVAADWDRQVALTKAKDLLRANPNISAFFAANDVMGLGIARAVADAGKTGSIRVVSVDGTAEGLAGVKSGDLTASVAQYPYVIGQMGVQACKAAAAGKTLPPNVKAPVALVTNENVAQAESKAPQPFATYTNPFAS